MYTPPQSNNIPFTFSVDGYSPPDYNSVDFNFSFLLANISSQVEILQLYYDEPHTVAKECKSIVSTDGHSIEVNKLRCEYSSIIDFRSSIISLRGISNIGSYVTPSSALSSDVLSYINVISLRGNIYSYVKTTIEGNSDIPTHVKPTISSLSDLSSYVNAEFAKRNMVSSVNIISVSGIVSRINAVLNTSSADIVSYTKSFYRNWNGVLSEVGLIEVSDVQSTVLTELNKDLCEVASYIRTWGSDYSLIHSRIHSFEYIDFKSFINAMSTSDIISHVNSFSLASITSTVFSVKHANIFSTVHGFSFRGIMSVVNLERSSYDIMAMVTINAPSDLKSIVSSFGSIEDSRDVQSYVSSFNVETLPSEVFVGPGADLVSSIILRGKTSDILSIVTPKIVHIKKSFLINLLDSVDLYSVVNTGCVHSMAKDLSTTLYSFDSRDLFSYVFSGDTADHDIMSYINCDDILVEDCIGIVYIPTKKYSTIHLGINSRQAGITFDAINVVYNQHLTTDFKSAVNSVLNCGSKDIATTLKCTTDKVEHTNYYVDKKVIDLSMNKFNWRKEIDIFFSSQIREAFYFEAEKKVYKKSGNWVIKVIGFSHIKNSGIERGKVRHKYIFDLSKYNTIDAAIRDAIKRVSEFDSNDLRSTVTAVISKHPFNSIQSKVLPIFLRNSVCGIMSRIKCYGIAVDNIMSYTNVVQFNSDISSTVMSVPYSPMPGDSVDFDFSDELEDIAHGTVDLQIKGGI
jgi:hypothetical protein